MEDTDYKNNIKWKEKFSNSLAEFREKAYIDESLMPKRYVLVLTNLCNLACTFCFQDRKKWCNPISYEAENLSKSFF